MYVITHAQIACLSSHLPSSSSMVTHPSIYLCILISQSHSYEPGIYPSYAFKSFEHRSIIHSKLSGHSRLSSHQTLVTQDPAVTLHSRLSGHSRPSSHPSIKTQRSSDSAVNPDSRSREVDYSRLSVHSKPRSHPSIKTQ